MNRRRIVALLAAFAVAGTLVFPAGAAPLFFEDTDGAGADVELAPSSDYAYLENGELVVDISASNPHLQGKGLNSNAVTGISDVFEVRYNGSQYAHVWLTHDSQDVTFSVDGQRVQSESNNVTLAPNQTVAVSLAVDTTGETTDGLLDDVTVHAKVADPESAAATQSGTGTQIDFDGATVQERAPTEDSRTFTVLGGVPDITYTFDASALELDRVDDAALTLDEVVVGNADGSLSLGVDAARGESSRALVTDAGAEPLGAARVTVETGSVANATLRYSVDPSYLDALGVSIEDLAVYRDSGGDLSKLDVAATGERDGRLRFEAETPGFSTFVVAIDRARVRVTDASLDQPTVEPGESVTVSATVRNDGSVRGERTVPVTVDGEVVAQRTVALDAGETAAVTVPVARNDTGEYAVAVDDVDAGAFTVDAAAEQVPDSTEQPPDSGSETDSESAAEPPSPEPTQEQSGFGLNDLLGVVTLLAITAVTLFLARRAPWR